MAKNSVPDAQDLDLTPIMNMVMVLIPMVMLNVVFTAITVIDVTMPQRSAGSAQNNGEPPKRLQLFISGGDSAGVTIVEGMMTLAPIEGCPAGGPTICSHPAPEGIETDRYDWLSLYNKLLEIKQKPEWKEHEQIEIIPDGGINFGVLVKAMDVARYQLTSKGEGGEKGKSFSSLAEFNDSTPVIGEITDADGNSGKGSLPLFPTVILGMPTVSN